MAKNSLDLWILKSLLIVAFLYHGVWNLGEEGLLWWQSQEGNLPFPIWSRQPVGFMEIILALWLAWGRYLVLPLLGVSAIMLGAILSNFPNGYSYKNLGIEVPLAYLGIAVVLLLRGGFFDRIIKLLNAKVR